MELSKAIAMRKSYRKEFKPDPIPDRDMREILEAGVSSPSGCNQQTTRFIGITEPKLAHRLAAVYNKPWAMSAPGAVILLTKETPSYHGHSYHVQDYSAAAENILLAAAGKGYASVWIEGQIEGEKAREMGRILGAPEDLTVAVYMPMGIPAEEASSPAKLPFEERAWLNGYGKAF